MPGMWSDQLGVGYGIGAVFVAGTGVMTALLVLLLSFSHRTPFPCQWGLWQLISAARGVATRLELKPDY